MPRVPITVMGFRCEHCEHEWVPRDINREPRACPACKNTHWNQPLVAMGYEQFREKVLFALKEATRPLTWTELRTTAKLPQMFPNNKWVKRLEVDIGLVRDRDGNRIMHWRLPQKNDPDVCTPNEP